MPRRAMSPEMIEEIQKTIIKAIRVGVTNKHAALSAGIDETTLYSWRHRYKEFNQSVIKSAAEAVVKHTTIVAAAASEGSWQASAWWLERRYPAEYARTEKRILSGDIENPIHIESRNRPVFDAKQTASIVDVLREAGAFSRVDDPAALGEPVPTSSTDDTTSGIPLD